MSKYRSKYGLTTECFGLEIPEIEEIRGNLRKANEIRCSFVDNTYIPRDLIEVVEPHREDLKQMARQEGIATRGYMKARVLERGNEIRLERVPYLYSYVFHFSPGLKAGKKELREILRPLVYDEGLIEIRNSRFPNHLGVRCVAVTRDGYIIISKRGLDLAVGKALYSLSCEGAVGVPWTKKEVSLKDLVQQQVSHELNLEKDEYEAYVLSYSRDLAMMGKQTYTYYLR